jgi:C4-dicarboxylate-binding protein DctP
MNRRALLRASAITAAAFAVLRHPLGETPLRLRCSLDTAPSHVRNRSITDYLRQVEAASGGAIVGEVFASGQLFADLNVGKALLQGQVDMAAPGAWTQTGIVPDCDFCQLPVFCGRPAEATERASDRAAGAHIIRQIEAKLRVKVVGPWLDVGVQNWYTTHRPLYSTDDLKGLKIRSPGGAGTGWRIGFFGGIPNVTAWPNVPLALSQGTFDGFVSTNESCATAKLWEAGVRYSYQDRQYAGQYIPMIGAPFWAKLTEAQQALMTSLWAQNIAAYRANALAAQTRARALMEQNGVRFTDPSDAQLAATRALLQADVATLVAAAKLSPDVVRLSEAAVNGTA